MLGQVRPGPGCPAPALCHQEPPAGPEVDVAVQYVRFEEMPGGRRKTRLWSVRTTAGNELVGSVFWKCAWRRYVMSSSGTALWDATCLREVADFCERQTHARREERRREREEGVKP